MSNRLLVVDNDEAYVATMSLLFQDNGYAADTATSGKEAVEKVKINPHGYALVVLDFLMPELNGAATAAKLRAINPDIFILILSGDPSRDALKSTWRAGAVDFVEKDDKAVLLRTVANWCRKYRETNLPVSPKAATTENEELIAAINMVGRSHGLATVAKKVHVYRESRRSVLVLGESGTGKELVAKALHNDSGQFLAVNCGCHRDNPTLLESSLFGHLKGAFTGADREKKGVFEEAAGGTVFLDEIHHLSTNLQISLLRVLQEKTVKKIGSTREIPVDFRLIASAKPELQDAVDKGTFMLDFYYRIKGSTIAVPPLRNRPDDIEPLVAHFVAKWSREHRRMKSILARTVKYFMSYPWPGNVRELENTVNDLLDSSPKAIVGPDELESRFFEKSAPITQFDDISLPDRIRNMEIDHVKLAIRSTPTICGAAKMLRLSPQSLLRLMEKHKISKQKCTGSV